MKMRLIGLLLAAVLASGCALLDPLADKIGDGVQRYCEASVPERQVIGDAVNTAAAPHAVAVECADVSATGSAGTAPAGAAVAAGFPGVDGGSRRPAGPLDGTRNRPGGTAARAGIASPAIGPG